MWKAKITAQTTINVDGTLAVLFDVYKEDNVIFSSQSATGLPDDIKELIKTKLRAYKEADEEAERLPVGKEITL